MSLGTGLAGARPGLHAPTAGRDHGSEGDARRRAGSRFFHPGGSATSFPEREGALPETRAPSRRGAFATARRAFCERLGKLCVDAGVSAEDIRECTPELAEFRQVFGADDYDRFLACGIEAGSCMEIAGCMGGVLTNTGERALDDMQRGFEKMRPGAGRASDPLAPLLDDLRRGLDRRRPGDAPAPPSDDPRRGREDPRPGAGRASDAPPLPPECQRADEVCSEDEPFARARCTEMVGNLKADPDNRKKLVTCYEQTKNCFEFKRCTDDLWFELH